MLLNMVLIVVGFALLIGSADRLVDAASDIAARFGISDRIVGLTIVAIGTSLPELMVGITSASEGHVDMALGNVAGSCLANLLLILGITAIITPVVLSKNTRRFDIPVSIAATGVLLLFANTGEGLSSVEGFVLTALFALFIVHAVVQGMCDDADMPATEPNVGDKDGVDEEVEAGPKRGMAVNILMLLLCSFVLKVAADLVVDGSVAIAQAFGLSEHVIGVTVVAIGTCLPELVTAVMAAARGNTDIAVGNVVGSNISNLLLVPGVTAMISPMAYDAAFNVEFLLIMACSALLLVFAKVGERQTMTRFNGACYVALCAAYLATMMM